MSETVNQENATNTTTEQPKANERLFTQDEVNSFFNKRYSDLMSQLTEFKEKASKYDELEEANKSELQKATERAEKLQTELDSIKKTQSLKEMRERVAKEAGVPASSLSLINGETEQACQEQAKVIMSMVKPGTYPYVPDRGEVQNLSKGSARDSFNEWCKATFN